MHVTDFDLYNITCTDKEKIEDTGAKLSDVNVYTIIKLQDFIDESKIDFALIKNGITTGRHSSPLHPKGLAVDIAVITNQKIYIVWKIAIKHFCGVGLYWNGKIYSLHLDMRPRPGYWSGTKNSDGSWKYSGIFLDPKNI